jgi:hypothetical protein
LPLLLVFSSIFLFFFLALILNLDDDYDENDDDGDGEEEVRMKAKQCIDVCILQDRESYLCCNLNINTQRKKTR